MVALLFPGDGMRLAREPAGDDVDAGSAELLGIEGSDVVMDWNLRPVVTEDRATERVDLAHRHRPEAASALESERDPSDP